jgi:exo-1,4-beta-D-glucosaminidase
LSFLIGVQSPALPDSVQSGPPLLTVSIPDQNQIMIPRTFIFLLPIALLAADQPGLESRLPLAGKWAIQSSESVHATGEPISTAGFSTRGWYPAQIPSTVLNTLLRNRVFPDPGTGMNLRSIPGTNYPISENYSNIPFPPGSPFQAAWWFRTEFPVPAGYDGKTIWLCFEGVNYRANVWLNGRQLTSWDKMAGAWRQFEFDVTRSIRHGQANALAVEVFPPQPDDLAITFVDWNPQPPDKNMGIWRGVCLRVSGPVTIRSPFVATRLNLPSASEAALEVSADLRNASNREVNGVLKGRIGDIEFSKPMRLGPGETPVVRLKPDEFPQLKITNPRLWWPAQVGPQNLYTAELWFETKGEVSDRQSVRFGIRDVTAAVDENGHLVFRINGKNILIRGAGYTFDMMLRTSPERQEAELRYVRDMNLNCVRLEGKLEDDHFMDLCDEMGILVLAGWCCCDHWERWAEWKDEDRLVSVESLRNQIRRLRSHPSVFDWMNGSDNPPPPEVERSYIAVLKEADWPNPYQSSATQKATEVTGASGVKMSGPYDYVAPSYWLLDKTLGGAHGFATEVGPGPSIPPLESLRQMLPEDHLWPIDSYWNYHTGGGPFKNVKVFTEALNQRYGDATTLEDYLRKAQVMAYEGHRAMFEAFGRNKYTSTGVIQWMLNNAWPSMIWHLYDYYLRPAGSYFGAKKACEPLHAQYSYDDRSIVIVNSYYDAFASMKIRARVLNLDSSERYSKEATLDVPADSSIRAFTLPEVAGLSETYFVQLRLEDSQGKVRSSNFYWLSTQPDVLDWDQSTWYHTPTKSYANLRALASLPAVDVKATASAEQRGQDCVARVQLENPSRNVAFSVHLRVLRAAGKPNESEILPVLWEDNYFPLLPDEKRDVSATYRGSACAQPAVAIDGWNVKAKRF